MTQPRKSWSAESHALNMMSSFFSSSTSFHSPDGFLCIQQSSDKERYLWLLPYTVFSSYAVMCLPLEHGKSPSLGFYDGMLSTWGCLQQEEESENPPYAKCRMETNNCKGKQAKRRDREGWWRPNWRANWTRAKRLGQAGVPMDHWGGRFVVMGSRGRIGEAALGSPTFAPGFKMRKHSLLYGPPLTASGAHLLPQRSLPFQAPP